MERRFEGELTLLLVVHFTNEHSSHVESEALLVRNV